MFAYDTIQTLSRVEKYLQAHRAKLKSGAKLPKRRKPKRQNPALPVRPFKP